MDSKATPSPEISEMRFNGPQDGTKLKNDFYWRGLRLPKYRTPMVQTALVGLIAFSTVGMSSALGGAGGGGLLNTYQSTNANVAIYSTFAALAFFAGSLYNKLGIRICLIFGGFGYACLSSAYLCTKHIGNRATPFIVVAGCIEGLSAAMLWTAQGAVTMAYPTEDEKGKAFSLFWTMYQCGGTIGSIIPICLNWNSTQGSLSDATYAVFITIQLIGAFVCPWLLLPSDQVVRSDGTQVVLPQHPTWKSELTGLYKTLIADKWIITLFPLFAASNWFYTYQVNDFTAPHFTIRTRSFNGLWSNFFNMVGVWFMGLCMDFKPKKYSRKLRARCGLIFIFVSTIGIWGGGWYFVKPGGPFEIRGEVPDPLLDVTQSSRYAPYIIMYIFYAFYDGAYQSYAYWLMGSLSNNSKKLARYSGWYKSIQSAAAAVVWRLDGLKTPYRTMYLSTWIFLSCACVTTTYVSFCRVQDHSDDEARETHGVDPEVIVGCQGVEGVPVAEQENRKSGLKVEAKN